MARRMTALSHRLGFESLEGRLMMAGNVAVNVTGGDLVVTGDGQGNLVQIRQDVQNGALVPGRYVVTGTSGTTINGQAGALTFQNVTDDFRINLNGGPDRLFLGNGLTDDLIVPDDLEINSGLGNDTIFLDGVSVGDDATVITSGGDDTLAIRAQVGRDGIGGGINDLVIDMGANSDSLQLLNTTVNRNLIINMGTDNFRDTVDIAFSLIGNDTILNTGAGNDSVSMFRATFRDDLTLNTAGGQDDVELTGSSVDELFLNLGTEADTLDLTTTTGRRATLNGSTGSDTLTQSGNTFTQLFQILSF